MNLTFDYFRNLKKPDIVLCNPDKRQIALMETRNTSLAFRFNDLSELTFDIPLYGTNAKGNNVKYQYYPRVEPQRLILLEGIGYFKITQVTEAEDGLDVYKSVTARSLQVRLNDFGFFVENRLYSFFNPHDPFDDKYDDNNAEHIPSVVGQLNKQLQVQVDPRAIQGLTEMEQTYEDWTISYINPALRYNPSREDNILRAFTDSHNIWGLDFIINYAAELFEVIFEFDFLRQAIKIKTVEEVTEKTNIYLSFENVMNQLQLTEQADDVVTVLACKGNNLDIRSVNPTGTNYIADFTHYMAEDDDPQPKWMSHALTKKIKEWQAEVDAATPLWEQLVLRLRSLYEVQGTLNAERVYFDLKLQDLEAARDRYLVANTDPLNNLEELEKAKAIFTAEVVKVGERSLEVSSLFRNTDFNRMRQHLCYRTPPKFIQMNRKTETGTEYWSGRFSFEDNTDGNTATFNENGLRFNDPNAPTVEPVGGHIYFADPLSNNNLSYCKLTLEVGELDSGDPNNPIMRWQVSGFERYTIFSDVKKWIEIYQGIVSDFLVRIEANNAEIESVTAQMNEISSALNLQKFFNMSDPEEVKLFRELKNYWIENEYTNDGFAVFDTTTQQESIDLARELLEEGKKHLAKINQPRFSIQVDAIDFTKIHEFKAFTSDLALGKVITIQKSDDVHFYPALTSMTLNLDDTESFTLVFSNALKPDSQDFLYADLAKQGAGMARSVTANWQEITSFSRRESAIQELLYEPLNRTLRAAQSNMSRQEFIIDDTGILGRRYGEDGHSFENEQIRIINNLLLFTDDGWQTAKTALGKLDITHPLHGRMLAYGLLAEAVVGSLIIGNTLYISNENNTIMLDCDGIKITAADDHSDVRFYADNSGNVSIKGNINAVSGSIGGLIVQNNTIYSDNGTFSINAAGYLQATSGKIGGWKIENNRLVSSNETTGDGYVGMRSDTDNSAYSFWAGWAPATSQKSFTAFLLTSIEDIYQEPTPDPEPTVAGTYECEGAISAIDDEGKNAASEYLETIEQVRSLKAEINKTLDEITFTFASSGAMSRYKFSLFNGAIILGNRLAESGWPADINIEEATITLSGTLMSFVFVVKEITEETVCQRCGLSEADCKCEPLCSKCGLIEGECICVPVCEVCKLPESGCTCDPICEVCGLTPSGCTCIEPCDCGETPCKEEHKPAGIFKKVGPFVPGFVPAVPVFIKKTTTRSIIITANYRQVYVEIIPEYVPNQGALQVFVVTSSALVSARNFSIEIIDTTDSGRYQGELAVAAGSSQSAEAYIVPIDLNKFNINNFQLRFLGGSGTVAFTQTDVVGTPTSSEPKFSIKPDGYLVASSGKIGALSFQGEGLYSSSFKLETVMENNRLVSNLTFFDTPDKPSATFTSNYLQVPTIYTESLSGNSLAITANEIGVNTLRANGTIHAGRIQGGGGAYVNVNEGAAAVSFTASFSHNWWLNEITVSLNRQVIRSVTVTVQYKVVLGNWHTMTYTFSGSTTSIKKTGVGAALGYENVSIISNKTFSQTPDGSGVRIQGNLNWNGRQLYINSADNTVRAY